MSEEQDQRSTAFGGGGVPNPLGGVVPGQTPGTTPPTFAGNASENSSGADPNDAIKKLLSQLMAQSQQRQIAVKPQAAPVPGRRDPTPPGYMQQGPGWGFERFAHSAQVSLQNAAATYKERQIQNAENDWQLYSNLTQGLEQAKTSGDPQKVQSAQQQLDNFVVNNPKSFKNMAKVFQQDWISPERTTAYGEAYKRHVSKMQKDEGAKKHAFQKLAQFFRGKPQPGQIMGPQEQQSMAREIEQKTPMSTPGIQKPETQVVLEQMKEESRQLEESKKETARQQEQGERETFQSKLQDHKDNFEKWKTDSTQAYGNALERMRSASAERRQSAHDATMLQALGIRLSDKDAKSIKGMTPTQVNTEINGSLSTMRQQYGQDSAKLRSLQTQLTSLQRANESKSWYKSSIDLQPVQDQIAEAQDAIVSTKKAIDYIEKNRSAIATGKADLDEVIDQAQKLGTEPITDLSDIGGKKVNAKR